MQNMQERLLLEAEHLEDNFPQFGVRIPVWSSSKDLTTGQLKIRPPEIMISWQDPTSQLADNYIQLVLGLSGPLIDDIVFNTDSELEKLTLLANALPESVPALKNIIIKYVWGHTESLLKTLALGTIKQNRDQFPASVLRERLPPTQLTYFTPEEYSQPFFIPPQQSLPIIPEEVEIIEEGAGSSPNGSQSSGSGPSLNKSR